MSHFSKKDKKTAVTTFLKPQLEKFGNITRHDFVIINFNLTLQAARTKSFRELNSRTSYKTEILARLSFRVSLWSGGWSCTRKPSHRFQMVLCAQASCGHCYPQHRFFNEYTRRVEVRINAFGSDRLHCVRTHTSLTAGKSVSHYACVKWKPVSIKTRITCILLSFINCIFYTKLLTPALVRNLEILNVRMNRMKVCTVRMIKYRSYIPI